MNDEEYINYLIILSKLILVFVFLLLLFKGLKRNIKSIYTVYVVNLHHRYNNYSNVICH